MRTTFIYALKEPDTGEIRYVGKADDPRERLRVHLCDKKRNHRTNWINSLAGKPVLEVVDEVPVEHWPQLEVAYIEFFREQGCNLVNGTLGGEGHSGPLTPEHCASISAGKIGKKFTLEHCKNISAGHLGKKLTLEHCAKLSAVLKGKKRGPFSPERCAKLSAAQTGKKKSPRTPEHCAKISGGWEKKRQEKVLAEMWS